MKRIITMAAIAAIAAVGLLGSASAAGAQDTHTSAMGPNQTICKTRVCI